MGTVFQSIEELIGATPLLELSRIEEAEGVSARILAKVESFNPAGSVKDRVAKAMLDDAEVQGKIAAGATVIEPTSGNTGVGLAACCAARGYHAVIVMPDTMSVERQLLCKAYGAEVVLTPGAQGMAGAVAKAEELHAATPNSIVAGQFVNPANPAAHVAATGPEIWEDADGCVDAFVACAGTGGTITGVGSYLKARKPDVHIAVVEAAGSPLLAGGEAGPHKIQGISANFVPEVLDTQVYDEVLDCPDEAAYEYARKVARLQGLLVGISSGAAVWGAVQLAKRPEFEGKTIVTLLPDTGERYLSTGLFE